jgi:hypothetical protein
VVTKFAWLASSWGREAYDGNQLLTIVLVAAKALKRKTLVVYMSIRLRTYLQYVYLVPYGEW